MSQFLRVFLSTLILINFANRFFFASAARYNTDIVNEQMTDNTYSADSGFSPGTGFSCSELWKQHKNDCTVRLMFIILCISMECSTACIFRCLSFPVCFTKKNNYYDSLKKFYERHHDLADP